jgi:GT2 family glycosyltransferase
MKKFAIGIPTYNRADLLVESVLNYINIDFKDIDIHIIDNGKQNLQFLCDIMDNVYVYEQDENLGVAKSWNKLCKRIFQDYEYALIINDDVYLGYNTEFVESKITQYPNTLITSFASWSMFIISKSIYNEIGEFDEIFYPAYYEDSDYIYRMKLKNLKHTADQTLNPHVLRISMTYELAPDMVNEAMQVNRLRYIEKWGGSPLLENFKNPYNK